ncbi:MAG: DUF1236 domain-containing protein [Methylocapsa sp.]|nr:DUF1236 domain-containing protein [Methylocapsa sp.]
MRSTLLTTAAAAALFTFPLAAYSQAQKSEQQRQRPAASEANQRPEADQQPMAQQKGAERGHAGRSAAEQAQPGTEMRGSRSENPGAQEQLKSKKPEAKRPAQKAEEQNPNAAPAQKSGTSNERMQPGKERMQPGKEKMRAGQENLEKRQPGDEKMQRQGEAKPGRAATESERAPRHTMRSNAPSTQRPGTEAQKPSGTITGGNRPPSTAAPGQAQTGRSATPAQGAQPQQGGAAALNAGQQADVYAALSNENVHRLNHANFALAAGTIIPGYIALNPLPESVVEIVPQYDGYDYVMVRDEIIIVDPQTRAIVTVLHGQGRSAAVAPAKHVRLTSKQRHIIMSDLRTTEGASIGRVYIGERVPEDIELSPIPQDVVGEIPDISPYQYFATGNEVVLVAPDSREVVDIVR